MMAGVADRKVWRGNEFIKIHHFTDVQIGDVVDHVDIAPKSCPVLYGDPAWHIMVTLPQIEAKTVERLVEAGYKARAFKVWRREATGQRDHMGRRKTVERERAMFPGYVFCDLRRGIHDFKAAASVKGALRLLTTTEGEFCTVPRRLIAEMEIREQVEREFYLESIGPKKKRRPDLVLGETVIIKDGPFAQFHAQISKMDDKGRVQLLVAMFGGPTKTWVDGAQVEKV